MSQEQSRERRVRTFDAIYLSPHLDDAAFSCGGQLHARAKRGEQVLVVNVFAGDIPEGAQLSPLAEELHGVWNLEQDMLLIRLEEDRRALEQLGVAFLHWEIPEALYRATDNQPLYPDTSALFGPPALTDDADGALRQALSSLPPTREVIAPLGAGRHVDHVLVHQTVREHYEPEHVYYYEDFPYASHFRVLGKALGSKRQWTQSVFELDEDDIAARVKAMACYESQVVTAFRDQQDLDGRVRAYIKKRGGERLWQRR